MQELVWVECRAGAESVQLSVEAAGLGPASSCCGTSSEAPGCCGSLWELLWWFSFHYLNTCVSTQGGGSDLPRWGFFLAWDSSGDQQDKGPADLVTGPWVCVSGR